MNTELAQLVGSEKQIKWAEKIREYNMRFMNAEKRALAARISTARWWIDNRDESMTLELLQAALEENEAATAEEQEAVAARKRNAREWKQYQKDVKWGKIKGYNYLSEKFGL